MEIAGKSALITGAGSGLGAETARWLASKGAKVGLIDCNGPAVEQVAAEVGGLAFVADVTSAEQIDAVVQAASAQHGTPRICINCAGIGPAQRVVGKAGPQALADFSQVIQVNLIGTFNVLRLVAAAMTLAEPVAETPERGVIINTASVAAFDGQIGQAAYSASKSAVVGMALPIARELARFGIRIMTIAPGLFATPLLKSLPAEVQESLAMQVPFPPRLGEPGEYARLAAHIIENEMLNAEVIRLDGAIRMQAK